MAVRTLLVVGVVSVLLAACSISVPLLNRDRPTSPPSASTSAPRPPAAAAPSSAAPEVVFGTGTVTVDGTRIPVRGDCDLSRAFGTQPIKDLSADPVQLVLAVDNYTLAPDAAFPVAVQVTGSGPVTDRVIVSSGVPGGSAAPVTFAGTVEVASLQQRRQLEFVDAATLHLEASQKRAAGKLGPTTRQLVVDIVCAVSRPG